MAEGGEAVGVSARTAGVEAGHVGQQDEEVGLGGPGARFAIDIAPATF